MSSVVIETPEHKAGRQAWEEGRPLNHNPYFVTNSCEWRDWREGWKEELEENAALFSTREDAKALGYLSYEDFPNAPNGCEDDWNNYSLATSGAVPYWWGKAYKRGWHEARNDAEMEFG